MVRKTKEWLAFDKINAERLRLINKKFNVGLTAEETLKLDAAEDAVSAYIEKHHPLDYGPHNEFGEFVRGLKGTK